MSRVDLAWSLRWFAEHGHTLMHDGQQIGQPLVDELERLTTERDELRAEVARLRADVAAAEEGAYRHGHVDGRAHAFAEMQQRTRAEPVRDHAAAERSRLDDLALDVARQWSSSPDRAEHVADVSPPLAATLDRLAVAYLPDGPEDAPR